MIDEKELLNQLERDRIYCEHQAERHLQNQNEMLEYGYNCEIARIDKVVSHIEALSKNVPDKKEDKRQSITELGSNVAVRCRTRESAFRFIHACCMPDKDSIEEALRCWDDYKEYTVYGIYFIRGNDRPTIAWAISDSNPLINRMIIIDSDNIRIP